MEQDPLSQLRDIHIPVPGGIWPPAPGWWVLLLVIMALVVLTVVLIRRKRQKNQWHRVARTELNRLANRAAATGKWFSELNALLKQSARARYPEQAPETLSGDAWVRFLIDTCPKNRSATQASNETIVQTMVASCWEPTPSCAPDDAIRYARQWMGGQKC